MLALHEFHAGLGAVFTTVHDAEFVAHYGDPTAEHRALRESVAVLDLSSRGRVVLLGPDRQKLLNGQVTNNVRDLKPGEGCYAALVNAKARMLADLYILALPSELLLDFEPGLSPGIMERLEKFIVADDVQVVDAAPHYGMFSVQGRHAIRVFEKLGWFADLPSKPLHHVVASDPVLGELHLAHHARLGQRGFDLYVPTGSMRTAAEQLAAAVAEFGGRYCGWDALEIARVEAGVPRYGADMDESNLPPECGIEERAISYTKGCYTGQEVIARIRTYGQVAKSMRGLRFTDTGTEPDAPLPERGSKLFKDGREVGYVTSAAASPILSQRIGLGYVRRECNGPGVELAVGAADGAARATITALPFVGQELA